MISDEDEEAIRIMLNQHGEKLTEWEDQFLNTLLEQGWMSKKQREIFDRLWDELVVQNKR
jgi:hypothetical protein